jgi:hypothetical protein
MHPRKPSTRRLERVPRDAYGTGAFGRPRLRKGTTSYLTWRHTIRTRHMCVQCASNSSRGRGPKIFTSGMSRNAEIGTSNSSSRPSRSSNRARNSSHHSRRSHYPCSRLSFSLRRHRSTRWQSGPYCLFKCSVSFFIFGNTRTRRAYLIGARLT